MATSLTVDELVVLISAQTKDFNQAIAQVNDKLDGIGNQSGAMSKKSVAAFGAIAGAAQVLVSKGINLITSSIGSAAKRVDTLNNSQKVFQNLGFATKDTKTQMDFLDKSIRGLPTTLNDAVTGVEALASVSGDLKDSTKTYKALNDGILAMGGSADMVNGAILQLSQLPLDGPLDAQTWNSLRQNGLTPVMVAMSKDMGISIAQMKDDFGSGKLTVQDFTDELQKLDVKGGGGMASLEKQAKDATHGITTGWANMQTAITRGVADIMRAIGTSNISGTLSGIGRAFEKGLANVANGIKNIKSYLGDLSKMNPQQAATTIGQTLGKALSLAFTKINIGFDAIKKFIDRIDWFNVGEFIVAKLLPGFVGGLIAGLGSDQLWKSLWSTITQHWGAILIGVLTIAFAPAKLLGPLTKIISKIPLIGPLTNLIISGIRGIVAPVREAFGAVFDTAFTDIGARVLVFMDVLKAVFGTIFKILWAPFDAAIQAIGIEIRLIPNFFVEATNLVKAIITDALNFVKNLFVTIFSGIFSAVKTIFAPFTEFFKAMFDALGTQLSGVPKLFTSPFSAAWNAIKSTWSVVTGWFGSIWGGIQRVFGGVSGWFGGVFGSAYNAVTGVFSRLTGFFSGLWSRIVGSFSGAGTRVGNAIGSSFKSVMNSILDRVAGMINGVFGAINAAIDTINKIPHVNISKIGAISVPHLATGGIVTAPTLSMIGEGGQPEAVIPLDKLQSMMGGGRTPVNVQIDGRTLLSFVIDGINNKAFMTNSAVIDF